MSTRAAWLLRAALCAAWCLAASSAAQAEPNPYLAEGIRLQQEMDHAQAVEALRRALAWGPSTSAERAKIRVLLGISQCNLLDWRAAEASFRSALAEDPSVELPQLTSPRITGLFERVRDEERRRRAQQSASRPATLPTSAPATTPRPAPPRPSLVAPGRVEKRRRWPAWTVVGVTAASLGAAAVLAGLSRQAEQEADDRSLPWSGAMARYDQARSRAIAADVLFGVSGAAAIVSAILLYRTYRAPAAARESRVAVSPLATGVQVRWGGAAW